MQAPEPWAELEMDLGAPASVVSEYIAPAPGRHLPQMVLATTLVAALPLTISLGLRASGVISGWVSVGLAVALSCAASSAGSAFWRKRGGHGEVLFGELLLWGWIRRWHLERELANATRLLDLVSPGGVEIKLPGAVADETLSVQQREHLLRQLAGALEGQDMYLNGHSRRVARHATMIARGMGLSNEEVARVRVAAAVHDVGKLRTPKAILNKPGRLTDAEFEVIKRHPVDGAEMVAALGDAELTRIVRHHHERLDGAGYPDRLSGDAIPLGARIISVADTFDAITSTRPYRDAAPHQKAIDILRQEAGAQLDSDAVRAFLAYYSGSRPTVVWAIVTSAVRRFVSWLTGDPAAAATLSAGKLAAATAATAAIGAAAGAVPVAPPHHPLRPVPPRSAGARPRGAALGIARKSTLTAAPAVTPASTSKASTQPAPRRTRRGPAHSVAFGRQPRHRAANPTRALVSTGAPGTQAAGGLSAPTGPRSSRASSAAPPSVTGQGAHGASPPLPNVQPSTPAHPAPPGHSQASLGNGHGKGNAYGHGKTPGNPHSGQSSQTSASPPESTSSHGNDNGQGSGNGNGNGQGSGDSQGNGNGNGNAKGKGDGNANANPHAAGRGNGTTDVKSAPTATVPTVDAGVQGNANAQGHGNAQGNGKGRGAGSGSSATGG